jgi:tetratricopeptide (TPR) repeat protein
VLFTQKNYAPALEELKRAEELQPSRADVHDLYAQVLQASGNNDGAISEFQQAVALSPGQAVVMLELAAALEKKGDWPAAIGEYHKAALQDASEDSRTKVVRTDAAKPQIEYKKAQERLSLHIAALKAAGKSAEAAQLEVSVGAMEAAPNLSEKIDADMQAGAKANSQRHFDEALKDYQEAVELAEKIQPHDQRLATALDHVGNEYLGRDAAAAEAAYEQELKVTEEIYGAHSANTAEPLQSLGRNALMQHDYATAEKFYFRAVDVNEKVYGETSDRVAASLIGAAGVYFMQQDYAKAEPYVLRAVHIDESLYGRDGVGMLMPLSTVCTLYDKWGNADKLELYDRQLLTVLEKQFGPSSPQLATTLTSEAHALHSLGREKEAADVENRLASIRSATMSTP